MFLDQGVFDPAFMVEVVDAAVGLGSVAGAASIYGKLLAAGFDAPRNRYTPPTATTPGYWYGRGGGVTLVLIGGAPSLQGCDAVYQGYFPPIGWSPGTSNNQYVFDRLPQIGLQLLGWEASLPTRVFLYGHSIGGCLAQGLMQLYQQAGIPLGNINAASTGAPRFAGGTYSDVFAVFPNNARWMYASDPVPLLPPRLADFPAIGPVIGPRNVTRFETFRHVIGGLNISVNATITNRDLPDRALGNLRVGIAAMMNGALVDISSYHSLQTYRGLFQTMVDRRFAPPPQPAVREEPAPGVGGGEFRVVDRAVVQAVRAQGAVQVAQVIDIPPERYATWRRSGNVWIVEIDKQFVAARTTKHGAEAMARAINNLIRQGLHSAVFDYESVVGQLRLLFDQSKDPTSNIKPAVADVFPAI